MTTDNRITTPYLTSYERARIIGVRAEQIARGAPVYLDARPVPSDPIILAEKELKEGRTPLLVRRPLPDGGFETWHVKELKL